MASYDNKVLTGDQLVYFSGLVKTALASKADSSALAGKQDALVFNTAYNASSNKVATMADIPEVPSIDFDEDIWENSGGTYAINVGAITDTILGQDIGAGQVVVSEDIDAETDEPVVVYLNDALDDIYDTLGNIFVNDIIVSEEPITGDRVFLNTVLDAKQDSLQFNTAYNASSNKVATMADITTALGGISSFSFEIVQSLPQSNISTSKIYLVAKQTSGTNQVYTEYAYVNNSWEIIGDTSMTIDTLTNQEVATIWSTATATT